MKKIVVFSDVHYGTTKLDKMIKENMDADLFFFLGDGLGAVLDAFDTDELRNKLHYVEGNCDTMYQHNEIVDVEDKKFFLTHGNKYHVKSDMLTIHLKGQELEVDAVCFGHTHIAYHDEEYGIHYINPGSVGTTGEYAVVYVENSEIFIVPMRVV